MNLPWGLIANCATTLHRVELKNIADYGGSPSIFKSFFDPKKQALPKGAYTLSHGTKAPDPKLGVYVDP